MNLNSKIEIPLPKKYEHQIKRFALASLVNALLIIILLILLGMAATLPNSLALIGLAYPIFFTFIFVTSLIYSIFIFIGYKKDSTIKIPIRIYLVGIFVGFAVGFCLSLVTIYPSVTIYQNYFIKDFGGIIFFFMFVFAIIEITLFSYIGVKITELIYSLTKKDVIRQSSIITLIIFLLIALVPLLTLFLKIKNIKNTEEKISEGFRVKNIKEIDPVLIPGGSNLMPRIRTPHTEFIVTADLYVPKAGDYEAGGTFFFIGGSKSKYGEFFHYFQQGWSPVKFVLEWERCDFDSPFDGVDNEGVRFKSSGIKTDFILIPERRKVYSLNYQIKPRSKREFLLHCH